MSHPYPSANGAAAGLPKQDLETPALCIDRNAYERNVARMAEFIIHRCGVSWRPHMKGQKAPELARRAVAAGAIGVTCATVYEAEAMVEAGISSILVANQMVGGRKTARLARLEHKSTVIAAIDDAEHLRQLSAAAIAEGVTIPVIIEVDTGMRRCGVAPGQPAVDLAKLALQTPEVRFLGVMGWEGHTLRFDPSEKESAVREAVGSLVATAEQCRAAGVAVEIVSCSGSGTYLLSSSIRGITEVQAGGGVFSDVLYERWGLDHDFALTVLTRVVSRPTPSRIIVDGGFKTMSFQHGYPRPLGLPTLKSIVLSAEHGILELETPSDSPRVGELVEFIPGYTDSTLCLHDEICVTRDGVVEEIWAIPGRSGRR